MSDGDDAEPSLDAARDRVVGCLVDLARALRARGAHVPADGSLVAARALAAVGLDDRERVRVALRGALVSREADLDTFDALFPAFWRQLRGEDDHHPLDPAPEMDGSPAGPLRGGADPGAAPPAADDSDAVAGDAAADSSIARGPLDDGADVEGADGATASVYSPTGARERVTGAGTADDDGTDRAVERLLDALAGLRGRRWTREGTERVDARRALRRGAAAGGAALPLPRRGRERDAVRVVLLIDVSRSVLDTIDRGFLLRFVGAVHRGARSARAFFFDTSIREVTDAFEEGGDAGRALERAEEAWGGGTRIGHSIRRLREDAPDAVDRRTVVLVVSDGLEVGELDDLERGMAWLSGRAGGVLWLNPLAASPEYEPACRGMALSLPYVDGLFAFADPADVEELARQLADRGLGGPVGYEYDPRRRDRARSSGTDAP